MGVHIQRQKDTEIHRGEDGVKETETEIGGMQPQAQESEAAGTGILPRGFGERDLLAH